ncbi:MAG: ArsR/SmtB family transcription factor [Solirubrobacteraceae bacterium]
MSGDADISAVASAIGHPARGAMLQALMDGRALTAGELARVARVARPTASGHLTRLTSAGLVAVESHGRHRYHRLADERVAAAVEGLAAIAPVGPVKTLRESDQRIAERAARSCYDHLAGAAGVALADRLVALGALERRSLALTDAGPFAALGVDVATIGGRRPLTRPCLDWSERRLHLAGGLGAAVLDRLLGAGWLERRPAGRALAVTANGRRALRDTVGLEL